MTHDEHLAWAKQRALEYVKHGDLTGAFTSMCSDLMKHPDLQHHSSTSQLGMGLMINGHLGTAEAMTKWIEGYQ